MDKVIRDGKVAVLYSPGYGAGWYSWHDRKELLFDPQIVEMVENNAKADIPKYVVDKYGEEYVCTLGSEDLRIEWIPEGTHFEIDEYDGYESVRYLGDITFIIA